MVKSPFFMVKSPKNRAAAVRLLGHVETGRPLQEGREDGGQKGVAFPTFSHGVTRGVDLNMGYTYKYMVNIWLIYG
jgi:hypothetical protein